MGLSDSDIGLYKYSDMGYVHFLFLDSTGDRGYFKWQRYATVAFLKIDIIHQ